MKTLRTYVCRSFLSTFLATVAVLTFIISIGGLFRITDLLARGIEPGPILQVFLSGLPNGMAYAIPVGTLTAALLVFGRLSGDSEITAMRACGISMGRVSVWLLPFALVASLVCLYVNSELMPLQYYIRWRATTELRADSALSLLEVGRTVSLRDDLRVFVGAIQADGTLQQIRIFDQRDAGGTREIKADSGVLEDDPDSRTVWLALERVTIDPFQFDSPGAAYSDSWRVELAQGARQVYVQRDKHQNFGDLFVRSTELAREADGLAEAQRWLERSKELQQNAYIEAESVRLEAWLLYRRAIREAEVLRSLAAEMLAADTASALYDRADEIASAAQGEKERLEQEALAMEQAVLADVQSLRRRAMRRQEASAESEERLRERAMDMRIVLNQRILLSFSPLLFLYFGIPMGIRPHRREGSLGYAASLSVMFLFYIILSVFGEFKGHPQFRPAQLVWIPGILLLCADIVLLRRIR